MTIRNVRSEADRMQATADAIQVTIAADASLSSVVRLHGRRIIAVEMPAAWTAASLTFLSGHDPDALVDVYDDEDGEITATVEAGRVVAITGANADALASLDYLQLRSGTGETAVAQAAERTLYLLVK